MSTLDLFCIVRDDKHPFVVKIGGNESVSALKDVIKEKKFIRFRDCEANSIVLWKVEPIPNDTHLKQAIEWLGHLDHRDSLRATDILSDIFPSAPTVGSVHVVIDRPPASEDPTTLQLFCYMQGDDPRHVFDVEIGSKKFVSALRKAIKAEATDIFRDVAPRNIVLWKVSIPIDPNLTKSIDELYLVDNDEPTDERTPSLRPEQKLSEIFSEPPVEGYIHIVVKPPPPSGPDKSLDPAPEFIAEEIAHANAVKNARAAHAPSTVSGSAKAFKAEQEERPIYNGRPADKRGPPVSIYHSVLAELKDALRDPQREMDIEQQQRVDDTAKLFIAATDIYESEKERYNAIIPHLQNVMDIKFIPKPKVGKGKKEFETDAMVAVQIKDTNYGSKKGVLGYLELKNEFGSSGDGGIQAALALRKHLAHDEHNAIRNASCCPCIVVSIAGPYICIGAAIFADAFVYEPFTDYIFLGGKPFAQDRIVQLSQIFFVVSQAFLKLEQFYQDLTLKSTPDSRRLFPSPTYRAGRTPQEKLIFTSRFNYEGRGPGDYRRSLFRATYGNGEVLVKFCDRYHGDSHTIVAQANLAPELFFCEQIQGDVFMVITKFINGQDAHYRFEHRVLPEEIMNDVRSAIKQLHNTGLVFGDLRRPNIMIEKQSDREHALLIDFEWVGQDGQARYPALLNDSGEIKWPIEVKPHAIMKKEHDFEMLHKLNTSFRIG